MNFSSRLLSLEPRLSTGVAGLVGLVLALPLAADSPGLCLRTNVEVDGAGVYLAQVVLASPTVAVPSVRLADSPSSGKTFVLTRDQILAALPAAAAAQTRAQLSGAVQVRVGRRMRSLGEAELRQALTEVLQQEQVQERGTLELRLAQNWTPPSVPDGPFHLRLLETPLGGVSPNFIVRFELSDGSEVSGPWQVAVQARVWQEVLIARGELKRGQLLRDASVRSERRDILTLRDVLGPGALKQLGLELSETIASGAPIYGRAVRVRPLIQRGQTVDALLEDGTLHVSLRVEVLEDGVGGQIVRVRNPQSRREFTGKVQDEKTILVTL